MIRELVRYLKQRFRLVRVPPRPVLDTVDFGRTACVILDVGANRGGFAGNILLRAPLATVHCFEPNKALLAGLERKASSFGMHAGHARCFVVPAAVGEFNERAELIVTGLAAASSLLPISQNSRDGWPSVDFDEQRRDSVEVIRLDSFMESNGIGRVKLLKLDVQGFEMSVLRGSVGRLKDIEYIVCEVQFIPLYEGAPLWYEIVTFLHKHGFETIVMDGFCFAPDGLPLQADMLFRNCRAA